MQVNMNAADAQFLKKIIWAAITLSVPISPNEAL